MSAFKTVIIVACAVSLCGCPDREAQTFWAQAILRPDDSCTVTALLGSQIDSLQLGRLDLSINRSGYFGAVQLVNGMARSEEVTGKGAKDVALENNLISITGVTVSYDVQGLQVALPSGFFQYTPMGIYPQEAAIVFVNLMPPPVLKVLRTEPFLVGTKSYTDPLLSACHEREFGDAGGWDNVPLGGREAQVLVRLRFEGTLHDGIEVVSNELLFPITICNGCLISPRTDDALGIVLDVFLPESVDESNYPETAPCIAGQDKLFDSRRCVHRHYFVDPSAVTWLDKCADDPTFPDVTDPLISPYLCRGPEFIGLGCIHTTPYRKDHMRTRYAIERSGAYCSTLEGESPTWPNQP